MECFAAFLSYTDAQLGRLLDFLYETGDRDNTLVVLVSDNGASAEGGAGGSINDARMQNFDFTSTDELLRRIDELGGPTTHNNYPWGWTMAGNTPFKRWKREVHEGGVADPCIINWPARVATGGQVRRQFAHAVDILPTVLELAGVEAPEAIEHVTQTSVDGISFAPLLGSGGTDLPSCRATQYFEMFGSRAVYHDGWKAVTFKPIGPLYTASTGTRPSARTAGSCTTWPRTRRSSTTWRRTIRSCSRPWWRAGGTRPGGTRCCPSTTGCCTRSPTRSRTGGGPACGPPTTRTPRRSPRPWRRPCRTAGTPSRWT